MPVQEISLPSDQPSEAITEAAPAMDPAAADTPTFSNVDALPSIEEAAPAEYPDPLQPFNLLGTEVPSGNKKILSWTYSQTNEGITSPAPVIVVHGTKPGPVMCLTAAIHGDELNGIEIVRRVLNNLDAEKLTGTLIGVPIVNIQGFHRASRYLPDRRDLNRYFPGKLYGSSASRIAYSFFNEIIVHCDALVDLHTGSLHRTNLPQLRADLSNPRVLELTQGFGATVVLHHTGTKGTLRRSATDRGIPAVTLETGGAMQLHEKPVTHGAKGILTLLYKLGMYKKSSLWGEPEPVYYKSTWVRTNQGGILFSRVALGQRVKKGQLLGTVTDPITNARQEIFATRKGRILGMALNQVVQPGFAAYRIGIQTSEEPDQVQGDELEDEEDPAAHPAYDSTSEEEPDLAHAGIDPDIDQNIDRDILEDSE
ncbi:MAG: succinylglutamate desuccinylase/aspartoacylase family protein [Pseudomonadales bacterium]|nr:succinylglutamate desuccinylase/aspartoacylase family protein [Pseudomonadales bacterium]